MGRIIPYIMENKKCLNPPARKAIENGNRNSGFSH
jgi:hypothetical protein